MGIEGVSTIFFGWHGVLDLRRFKGVEERIVEFAGELNSADLRVLHRSADDYFRGSITPEEFWGFIGAYYGLNSRTVNDNFRSYLISIDINQSLWSELPALSERYKLGILSDSPRDKTELIMAEVDLSFFEGRAYFSSEYDLLKNDAAFFDKVEKGLGVHRSSCLFVDDDIGNVNYAKVLGFKGHLYTNNDSFLRLFD